MVPWFVLWIMKTELVIGAVAAVTMLGCGRNEPGTMGGEPGVPETVATGAPAQAAKETSTTDANQPALASEQSASTFDDPATNNAPARQVNEPDASAKTPNESTDPRTALQPR